MGRYQKSGNTAVWRQYEYVVTPDGVTIVGFLGEGVRLEIPEQITVDAREYLVRELGPYAFQNHRELQEIYLPDNVKKVGSHCFFDCRKLKKLSISDQVTAMEDGAFKNCEALSQIRLRVLQGRSACMKGILGEQNRELKFHLIYKNQRTAEGDHLTKFPESKLIMPRYQLDYEANVEARIINQITYGSGVHYRECISDKDVNYAAYDQAFSVARIQDSKETLIPLCLCRLEYPYQLSESAKKSYQEYLVLHFQDAIRWACKNEEMQALFIIIESGTKQGENSWQEWIQQALEVAHMSGRVPAISYLMELRQNSQQAEELHNLERQSLVSQRGKTSHKFSL